MKFSEIRRQKQLAGDKPLTEFTDRELAEAVQKNNRVFYTTAAYGRGSESVREWRARAKALMIECKRRGLIQINGDRVG